MKTAVQWLINEINEKHFFLFSKLGEQALKIEKEQIMKAVYDSMGTNFDPNMGRAELYYNENYGK